MRIPLEVPARAREKRDAARPVHVDNVHGVPRAHEIPARLSQEHGRDGLHDVRGDPRPVRRRKRGKERPLAASTAAVLEASAAVPAA